MTKPPASTPALAKQSLATLAKQINSLNAGVVDQMVQSGKLLLQAKDQLERETGRKRGGFQDWVRANLKLTPQTATRYMRLAKARNPLTAYAAQKSVGRKKRTTKQNVGAPSWGTMSPINRAKAAFNVLQGAERQDFLKWVADQFDNEPASPSETPARRVSRPRATAGIAPA